MRVDGVGMEYLSMCNRQHLYRRRFFKDSESPLASRAWILPERQLSPRMLYFGSKQMYFECLEVDCWESIRYAAPKGTNDDAGKRAFNMELVLGSFYNVWYYIVSDYTSLRLTAESDKLRALSGITHRVQSRIDDDYIAGLWRKDLANGLLCEQTRSLMVLASCDRHVTFATMGSFLSQGFDPKVRHYFEVIHAEAAARGADPCGEVHAGLLKLHGTIREASIRRYRDDEEEEHLIDLCSNDDNADKTAFIPDAVRSSFSDISLDAGKPVVALLMATMTRAEEVGVIALALEAVDERKQIFRRSGIASFHYKALPMDEDLPDIPAWFERCSRQMVQVI
ncbi:hypothetical protein LTR85_001980 [Meristemomyces frigidus]|nr:hypothetical protein LTR85_001980 [Meristemomyces frigidus]